MFTFSITRKLQIMIASAIIALFVVGGAGLYGITALSHALVYTQTNTLPSIEAMGGVATLFAKYRLAILRHIQNDDASKMPELDKAIADIEKELNAKLDDYDKNLVSDQQDKELVTKEKELLTRYREAVEKGLSMSRSCLVSYDHISQRILKLATAREVLGSLLADLKAQRL